MKIYTLDTARLLLRQWKENDYLPFAKQNVDATVMEYFPSTLSTEESNMRADIWQKNVGFLGCGRENKW